MATGNRPEVRVSDFTNSQNSMTLLGYHSLLNTNCCVDSVQSRTQIDRLDVFERIWDSPNTFGDRRWEGTNWLENTEGEWDFGLRFSRIASWVHSLISRLVIEISYEISPILAVYHWLSKVSANPTMRNVPVVDPENTQIHMLNTSNLVPIYA